MKTRNVTTPVLDRPATDLCGQKLPTISDVLGFYFYARRQMKINSASDKEPSRRAVTSLAVERVAAVWKSAGLPTVTTQRIEKLIKDKLDLLFMLQYYPTEKRKESYVKKKDGLLAIADTLLEIGKCKCRPERCICGNLTGKKGSVEWSRRAFLHDQRTTRQMVIDPSWSDCTQGGSGRKRPMSPQPSDCNSNNSSATPSPAKRSRKDLDEDYQPPVLPRLRRRPSPQRNMAALTNTVTTATRFKVSSRAAAALVSAFSVDMGLVTPDSRKGVVDPNKMKRETTRVFKDENQSGLSECQRPSAIYFDGRKDSTLVSTDLPGECSSRIKTSTENHVVLLQEPGSRFIGHVTPQGSKAVDEADAIIGGLRSRSIQTSGIRALGCDGTSYNTGPGDGVLASIEKRLHRPLQRNICALHFNELPLRRIMTNLDGPTSGPKSWTGPIGKKLADVQDMPIKKFKAISISLPLVDENILSCDQKYLHAMCVAISAGEVSQELAARLPGKLHQARWLTTACRILRLYVSTSRPSATLRQITEYIVTVYAVCWFSIRKNPLAVDGPRHLLDHIKLSRNLPLRLRRLIHESIAINAFYAHPENILLAMVVDERQEVRATAVERILEARSRPQGLHIRRFQVPPVNFDASDYVELIDWHVVDVTPPPLLADLSQEELLDAVTSGQRIHLPRLPCHTQAVERYVQEVTAAASHFVGEERRDGSIRTTVTAREAMPKFTSKCAFKAPKE